MPSQLLSTNLFALALIIEAAPLRGQDAECLFIFSKLLSSWVVYYLHFFFLFDLTADLESFLQGHT